MPFRLRALSNAIDYLLLIFYLCLLFLLCFTWSPEQYGLHNYDLQLHPGLSLASEGGCQFFWTLLSTVCYWGFSGWSIKFYSSIAIISYIRYLLMMNYQLEQGVHRLSNYNYNRPFRFYSNCYIHLSLSSKANY